MFSYKIVGLLQKAQSPKSPKNDRLEKTAIVHMRIALLTFALLFLIICIECGSDNDSAGQCHYEGHKLHSCHNVQPYDPRLSRLMAGSSSYSRLPYLQE
jgi:hypothetical protein